MLHASRPQNQNDPLIRKRLIDDSTGNAGVERTAFAQGPKVMAPEELVARAYDFFQANHTKWAAEFRDYVLNKDVPEHKFDTFHNSFTEIWVDGRKRRQHSAEMLAIKASMRVFDRCYRSDSARHFVINQDSDDVPSLFTPTEMAVIYEANSGLIEAYLPDYIDHLGDEGPGSLGDLYVRRGVYMPTVDKVRRELHYLSSYSLAIGTVEQFAQTWTRATQGVGVPSIFSAPISAVQDRVVAFAPFIEGMDLSQLELVVAPPLSETPLQDDGVYGKIREFSFC